MFIYNLHSSSIIKESSSYLYKIFQKKTAFIALQKKHINALLIIAKSMKLDDKMVKTLTEKLSIFDNLLTDKFENSQLVLFYGYISYFYILI